MEQGPLRPTLHPQGLPLKWWGTSCFLLIHKSPPQTIGTVEIDH